MLTDKWNFSESLMMIMINAVMMLIVWQYQKWPMLITHLSGTLWIMSYRVLGALTFDHCNNWTLTFDHCNYWNNEDIVSS